MPVRRVSRDERKALLLEVMQRDGRWLSLREWAELMGLTKTPYLRELIEELVDEGKAEWTIEVLPNRADMTLYHASELHLADGQEAKQG